MHNPIFKLNERVRYNNGDDPELIGRVSEITEHNGVLWYKIVDEQDYGIWTSDESKISIAITWREWT